MNFKKETNKTPNPYNFLTWKKSEENLTLTTCLHVSYLAQFWWFYLLFIPVSPCVVMSSVVCRGLFYCSSCNSGVFPGSPKWLSMPQLRKLCSVRRVGCWWNLWAGNESVVLCPTELLWFLSFTRMTKSFSIVSNLFSYKQLKYPWSIVQGIQGHGLA